MKPSTNEPQHPVKNPLKTSARERLTHIATLLLCVILASCATSPGPRKTPGQHPTSITPVNQRNWVQVSSHPSVWYPHGVPKDAPTDFQGGEWIPTGDDKDTRFFIPFKGIPSSKRQSLREEALASRSEKKLSEIENDHKVDIKKAAGTVALIPVATALTPLIFAGMIYTPWYFHRESENPAH